MSGRAYYLTTLGEWKRLAARFAQSHWVVADPFAPVNGASHILVLVEGDESVHLELEGQPSFELLPHPLSNRALSERVIAKLSRHGVPPGATTFELAEAVARAHPLLRHRVF